MPEICRFLGIVIKMFYSDHSPPHFHVEYQNFKAVFNIHTSELMEGKLPKIQLNFVTTWALLRKKELMTNWKSLIEKKGFNKIDPLRGCERIQGSSIFGGFLADFRFFFGG